MTKLEQALRQALEALEELADSYREDTNIEYATHFSPDPGGNAAEYKQAVEAITALREALAASEWEEDNGMSIAEIFAKQEALAERKVLTMTQEEIVDAIRSAKIEQAEQEPVGTAGELFTMSALERLDVRPSTKIYLNAAPVRTKDLTDDEIADIRMSIVAYEPVEWGRVFARAVIAADREKNK